MKYRLEKFGGIIANENPPFLAFVDREFMVELGVVHSSDIKKTQIWQGDEDNTIGTLSAPTEVHFSLTNDCPNCCRHCYTDSGSENGANNENKNKNKKEELNTDQVKDLLKNLADMGVFHVALGGGEAMMRPDLFEIAAHARSLGLVPNLTISGTMVNKTNVHQLKVFGQINVSLDGVGDFYGVYRGKNLFSEADHAIKLMREVQIGVGINTVVGSANFDHLPELFKYAHDNGLSEIECLRLKPAGRGGGIYTKYKLSEEQNKKLIPYLAKLAKKYRLLTKIDCSFVPMYCYHRPSKKLLEKMATYGCEAGNVLLGIKSSGEVSGCSFLEQQGLFASDLKEKWQDDPVLKGLRDWSKNAPMPCKECHYLDICKGGCKAVSQFVTGNWAEPDPDCPFVVDYEKQTAINIRNSKKAI